MSVISFSDFLKVDIRVGTIKDVKHFEQARKPAYKIWIDFGEEIGVKKTSAQITALYMPEDLIETQVLAVINFPVKQIADFMSEVLILGMETKTGVILLRPDSKTKNGSKVS